MNWFKHSPPTQRLLHTYNRHDHHHIKICTPYEQYFDWGKKHQLYLHSHLKSDAAQRQGCSELVLLEPRLGGYQLNICSYCRLTQLNNIFKPEKAHAEWYKGRNPILWPSYLLYLLGWNCAACFPGGRSLHREVSVKSLSSGMIEMYAAAGCDDAPKP